MEELKLSSALKRFCRFVAITIKALGKPTDDLETNFAAVAYGDLLKTLGFYLMKNESRFSAFLKICFAASDDLADKVLEEAWRAFFDAIKKADCPIEINGQRFDCQS